MARPREFDVDLALDAAMGTFWTQGYEATSMTDLVEATGLQKGSLYKAFADKHDIFMQSLSRYLEGAYEKMSEVLSGTPTPVDGLRGWLLGVVMLCRDQRVQRGCFAMNTAVELGPHDTEARALIQRHHARASSLLTETIVRGQQSGQIRTDLSADQLSNSLFVFSAGMLGTTKVLGDTIDTEEMIEAALAMIAPAVPD